MSGLYSPARAIFLAKQDVGFHEGPDNRNPYSLWQYGFAYNPWCDSAVCYWSYQAGFRFPTYSGSGEKGDFNVGTHHRNAERMGIWRSTSTNAKPGWLIVLSFDQPDQHIEMVIADGGSKIITIGGNTGDMVAYRTRYRTNVVGFIALDEALQNAPDYTPLTTKEIKTMGMKAAASIPGAKAQTKAPWKGRKPFVGAILQPNGTTDMCGFNGATLPGGAPAFGMSIVHLGKLIKPITEISPETNSKGDFSGLMIGLAEDGGTFAVKPSVKYL